MKNIIKKNWQILVRFYLMAHFNSSTTWFHPFEIYIQILLAQMRSQLIYSLDICVDTVLTATILA